ncbi:ADP-ribosylglycohydrolase family protein [Haloprofundus marisrubri]|uniref:ADP-ribosylglycohydrolase family protein n=1 Tax=Haloprofundus marisrubri TaxID=1514971 RepID=UPI0009E3A752
MTEESRAQGCLLGLACGDALGRPVEFKSASQIKSQHGKVIEMLANGTHGQPAGTITDDTEMALCIAESLVDKRGFDPSDVGNRFVDWLESDPFDIGLMTRDAVSHIRKGRPWDEAGVDVWESRPEGSNAGNGSVMRCAPHAIAFRHFDDELIHVSRLSSSITHADPRCQWGCVILNRTLANLIRGESDPLQKALGGIYDAPDELTTALKHVQKAIDGEVDQSRFEAKLKHSGYVVDSLQAGLYYGLTADSAESAIVQAVNEGDDADTVGAIAGAVAGARFGAKAIPNRWTEEIDEARRLKQLAKQLLSIRLKIPGKKHATLDDSSIVFKERTIEGPTYIPISEFQRAGIGHRPHPAPHRSIRTEYHDLTPATATMLDWEQRAYAVESGRTKNYKSSIPGPKGGRSKRQMVAVPQYSSVDSFDELPKVDQQRIEHDSQEAAEALIRACTAFTAIRHPITELETEAIGIDRMDPIAGATRVFLSPLGDLSGSLLGRNVCNGYDSPDEIEALLEGEDIGQVLVRNPNKVHSAVRNSQEVMSGAAAILDYVTNIRASQRTANLASYGQETTMEELRNQARQMVGELHVMYESLRRVAVRHPEVDYAEWRKMSSAYC